MTATTTEPEAPEMVEYTVLVGAVTIATGRPNPQNKTQAEVVRLVKGQTITASPEHESIVSLLSMKSLRRTSEVTGKERVTPRSIMKAYQDGERDAAERGPIIAEVEPVDAPLPLTDPNDL